MPIKSLWLQVFAYKCNNISSFISGSAALIVDDINDNLPEIYLTKTSIVINEETFTTLFTPSELSVADIDLGPHASYEVVLTQDELAAANFAEAFIIIPGNGYQEQTFTITVADTALIDFEDPDWRSFEITVRVCFIQEDYYDRIWYFLLQIKATETDYRDHETSRTFTVELLNWNDELPAFELDDYTFQVLETVSEDFSIGVVKANDRDVDDVIE